MILDLAIGAVGLLLEEWYLLLEIRYWSLETSLKCHCIESVISYVL